MTGRGSKSFQFRAGSLMLWAPVLAMAIATFVLYWIPPENFKQAFFSGYVFSQPGSVDLSPHQISVVRIWVTVITVVATLFTILLLRHRNSEWQNRNFVHYSRRKEKGLSQIQIYVFIFCLAVLTVVKFWYAVSTPLSPDESSLFLSHVRRGPMVSLFYYNNHPLSLFLSSLVFRITNDPETALRLPSLLFMAVASVYFFRWLNERSGFRNAMTGFIFFQSASGLMIYGIIGKGYLISAFFAFLLVVELFLPTDRNKHPGMILLFLISLCGMLATPSFLPFLASAALLVLLKIFLSGDMRGQLAGVVAMICGTLPALTLYLIMNFLSPGNYPEQTSGGAFLGDLLRQTGFLYYLGPGDHVFWQVPEWIFYLLCVGSILFYARGEKYFEEFLTMGMFLLLAFALGLLISLVFYGVYPPVRAFLFILILKAFLLSGYPKKLFSPWVGNLWLIFALIVLVFNSTGILRDRLSTREEKNARAEVLNFIRQKPHAGKIYVTSSNDDALFTFDEYMKSGTIPEIEIKNTNAMDESVFILRTGQIPEKGLVVNYKNRFFQVYENPRNSDPRM